MKEEILIVEPKLDHFIRRYHVKMIASVLLRKNIFDYRVGLLGTNICLFKFLLKDL